MRFSYAMTSDIVLLLLKNINRSPLFWQWSRIHAHLILASLWWISPSIPVIMRKKHLLNGSERQLRPCLDAPQKLKFFHSLSITSIFGPMHEVVNIGKKITNYTV
jgi:hypothetical protein